MRVLRLTPLLVLLFMPSNLLAQADLTLADAMARALAKNRDVLVEREEAVQAEAGVEQARAAWDPTIQADLMYRDQKIPVTSILSGAPEGELAPTTRGVAASAVWTQLFTSGASVNFFATSGWDWSNSVLTLLTPSWPASFGVEARMPLLQNRTIDPARRAIRVAQVTRERSVATLRRVLSDTTAAVEQAYWNLVAAQRDVDIRRTSVKLAEEQREEVANRIEGKVAPEADAAQPAAEIARRRGDAALAIETRARAEHALKALILASADDPLWNVPLRPTDPPEMAPAPVDVGAALVEAQKERAELADLAATMSIQDIEIEAARDRLKPQLDLVGSYTTRGLAGSRHDDVLEFPFVPTVLPPEVEGGPGNSLENLLRQRFPDATVGVALTIPIGQRAAKADVASAESGRRQVLLLQDRLRLQIVQEVRNAIAAVESAAARVETARATREAAEVQLQAEQDRYAAGVTTPFFVLTRQNDLTAARAAEIAAASAYRGALAELSRAKGTLLAERNIQLTRGQ
jgi:outer membrane protein TolC